jgi:hypothetical protein
MGSLGAIVMSTRSRTLHSSTPGDEPPQYNRRRPVGNSPRPQMNKTTLWLPRPGNVREDIDERPNAIELINRYPLLVLRNLNALARA